MSEGKKALLMCVLAFVLGCVVVSMGCVAGAGVRVDRHGAGAGAGVEVAP